jgi:hypothetical protein
MQEVKLLIFAHHKGVLDAVSKKLDGLKVGYMRIDGDTKQQDRQVLGSCALTIGWGGAIWIIMPFVPLLLLSSRSFSLLL